MTTCTPETEDPFRCPTKWELWRQILALLPRGRAWQTHESVAERWEDGPGSQVGTFEVGATGVAPPPPEDKLTVLQQFWAAYAEVLEHLHQRGCALLDEMFCATTTELRAEWGVDYGVPGDCEPWDTLCDKVRAQGGATCGYLAELAARLRWTIVCQECAIDGRARASRMRASCSGARSCGSCPTVPTIYIRIITAASPAYLRPTKSNLAGRMMAGCNRQCDAVPYGVFCLIEKFKPAHVRAIYEVI